jgi:hypothetical protein
MWISKEIAVLVALLLIIFFLLGGYDGSPR